MYLPDMAKLQNNALKQCSVTSYLVGAAYAKLSIALEHASNDRIVR